MQRTIRRLHLAAQSEADVRAVLPRLEDALRCASLPDDAERLVIVRHLKLGRIAPNMSAQTLSRLLENRLGHSRLHYVHGATEEAARAEVVWFRHVHEARCVLAQRLVQGQTVDAWFWPRAVAEFKATATPAENLWHMLQAIAQQAQARVFARAWVQALLDADGAVWLSQGWSEQQGRALLAVCGVQAPRAQLEAASVESAIEPAVLTDVVSPALSVSTQRAGATLLLRSPARTPLRGLPQWLQSIAVSLDCVVRAPHITPSLRTAASSAALRSRSALMREGDAVAEEAVRQHPRHATQAARRLEHRQRPMERNVPRVHLPEMPMELLEEPAVQPVVSAVREATQSFPGERFLTQAGGLLFLLRALSYLDYEQWSRDLTVAEQGALARAIFHGVLRRLRLPADDATWRLIEHSREFEKLPRRKMISCAAPTWLLEQAAPQAGTQAVHSVEGWTQIWVNGLRRFLRREAKIGLASLVLRPARVSFDATHVDVYLPMDSMSLAVRRAGLDLNPGWVPWYGQVVSFIYEQSMQ